MEYIGRLEKDRYIYGEEIVIFGAGKGLYEILDRLEKMQIKDKIVCICDNDPEKHGKKIEGIEILNPKQIFSSHSSAAYIVYNQFCGEICKQLVNEGIYRIHLIRG